MEQNSGNPFDNPQMFDSGSFVKRGFDEDLERIKEAYFERITKAALTSGELYDLEKENELVQLIRNQQRRVGDMQRKGVSPEQIKKHIENSLNEKKIKALLIKLGIAKMITDGDWIVNRSNEIPYNMGVVTFPQIKECLTKFLFQEEIFTLDYLSQYTSKENDFKLKSVDWGCGNGEMCNTERWSSDFALCDRWEQYGYADYIYFTLKDFLNNLLKSEFQSKKDLVEFVNVISTLLIREIHFQNAYGESRSTGDQLLLRLPSDLNVIRQILPKLDKYINLRNIRKLRVDMEFLSDTERNISDGCENIVNEYLNSPEKFVTKYFINEVQGLSVKDKRKLTQTDTQLKAITKKINKTDDPRDTQKIKRDVINKLQTGEIHVKRPMDSSEHEQVYNRRQTQKIKLKQEKKQILHKLPDLSYYISLYHYNLIPAKFDELGKIFPDSSIHFQWAFRSTSHLDNELYKNTVKLVATTIAPGGIFLEDGKRESYTRLERLNVLRSIQEELGPEYKIKVITDGYDAKSVLLERAVVLEDGRKLFFADIHGEEILREGCEFVEIDNWETKLPEISVRNKIIEILKDIFIKPSNEIDNDDQKRSELWRGRMHFREAHQLIRNELESVFGGELWQYLRVMDGIDVESPQIKQLILNIAEKVAHTVQRQSRSTNKDSLGIDIIPMRLNENVQTFPRNSRTHLGINKPRFVTIKSLPRNLDIPTLEALQGPIFELMDGLNVLQKQKGVPPINIIEFDNCFTNPMMVNSLRNIIGPSSFMYEKDFSDFVRVQNVTLQSGIYPNIEDDGTIYIVGGSTYDAYNSGGLAFTEQFCIPLLEKITKGDPIRVFGVCFGSQVILQALGILKDKNFRTKPGALQFGAFPIVFSNEHQLLLKQLSGGAFTVGMTRGAYSQLEGYEELDEDMVALAHELNTNADGIEADKHLPPVALSLLKNKVITSQFHPEISLTSKEGLRALRQWLIDNNDDISSTYSSLSSPDEIYSKHLDIKTRDKRGIIEPWIKSDIGPPLLVYTLLNHVNSLKKQLNLKP